MARSTRESDQAMIRLPKGMRDRIKAVAYANGRSMNAEIIAALDAAFPDTDEDIDKALRMIESRLDAANAGEERKKLESIRTRLIAERWFEPPADEE